MRLAIKKLPVAWCAAVVACLVGAVPMQAQGSGERKLSWLTYVPGNLSDVAQAVRVDSEGGVWIAGSTSSTIDFPGPNDPRQVGRSGPTDIFLARYVPNVEGGARLTFWTWLGGSGDEDVRAIELDSRGRVYVVGSTSSTDFPVAGAAFQTSNNGGVDAYLAVFDPSASGQESLIYSSYFGGANTEVANALAIGPDGHVVVVGYTNSDNLANVGGRVQEANRGGYEAFLFRVDPAADPSLHYATYFGGKSTEVATGVVIGVDGITWMSGYTSSDDFPVTENGLHLTQLSGADGFLVGFDLNQPGLNAHHYGTFFGGTGADYPTQLRMDAQGDLWVAGYTYSSDLPITVEASQREPGGGGTDAFLMRLDPRLPRSNMVRYASYLGGNGAEVVYALALLNDGRVALSGYSMFGQFPTTGGAIQLAPRSEFAEPFVTLIDPRLTGRSGLTYSTYLGGRYNDVATGIVTDLSGAVYITGYSYSPDLPVTDGSLRHNAGGSASAFVAKLDPELAMVDPE